MFRDAQRVQWIQRDGILGERVGREARLKAR